jgi:hypothetical protein
MSITWKPSSARLESEDGRFEIVDMQNDHKCRFVLFLVDRKNNKRCGTCAIGEGAEDKLKKRAEKILAAELKGN